MTSELSELSKSGMDDAASGPGNALLLLLLIAIAFLLLLSAGILLQAPLSSPPTGT